MFILIVGIDEQFTPHEASTARYAEFDKSGRVSEPSETRQTSVALLSSKRLSYSLVYRCTCVRNAHVIQVVCVTGRTTKRSERFEHSKLLCRLFIQFVDARSARSVCEE